SCEPVYSTMPCACDGEDDQAPGDWECFGCEAPTFDRCIDAGPRTCGEASTPEQCDGLMGCHWEDEGFFPDPSPEPPICDCPEGDPDCGCSGVAPAPRFGTCVEDGPKTCWDIYFEEECLAVPGCAWDYEDGTFPEPPPCDCDPDDSTCACAGIRAPGLCYPEEPIGCGSHGDELSCKSDPTCDWYWDDTTCVCPDDVPCNCLPVAPEGRCDDRSYCNHFDELSCTSDPACQWTWFDGEVPPDPICDPVDPNCGAPAPPPDGMCEPRDVPPPTCSYGDRLSCSSDPACEWIPVQDGGDFCDPSDPNCGADPIPVPPPDECW